MEMPAVSVPDFCSAILGLDRGIRFVGIANMQAQLIHSKYRGGILPLISEKELEKSILQSAIRMGTRSLLESKMGETIYSFSMYSKVKRATIPLRKDGRITHILMVSFDVDVDHDPLILSKIIPLATELSSVLE